MFKIDPEVNALITKNPTAAVPEVIRAHAQQQAIEAAEAAAVRVGLAAVAAARGSAADATATAFVQGELAWKSATAQTELAARGIIDHAAKRAEGLVTHAIRETTRAVAVVSVIITGSYLGISFVEPLIRRLFGQE